MDAALNAHRVDAAWMVEPFISQGKAKYGLRELYDTNLGATSAFPIAGYVSTQAFEQKDPKTGAAFVRAVERGQQIADTNKAAVAAAMVKFLRITPAIAAVMVPDMFPLGVSRVRIQRVANLMQEFGQLKHPFNVVR